MFLAAATPVITAEMLAPVVDTISANATVILPIGVAIMGIMVGIGLIPRLLYKFI